MDESLWPARNIAEYAYCPRLFYLMQVEGIFLPSSDTEKGKIVHKRVDKPSLISKNFFEDAACPKIMRSLVLTSETYGITATLDIAEINGQIVVPVEYRKGFPRRKSNDGFCEDFDGYSSNDVEPWPTDRVQLGLQSILLKEAGYVVNEAVIYYSSVKLRFRIVVDDVLEKEALNVLNMAKHCADGPRPLPLVNDPRCSGCSLQPQCLPDEIVFERSECKDDDFKPRKIWPLRDDGIHVVAQKDGVKVGVHGEELRVVDKDGSVKKTVPLVNLESLSLIGSVQISTQAIHTLSDMNVPIAFLSGSGRLVAMMDPMDSVSAQVRKAQVFKFDREDICLDLVRSLVSSKILNQRTLLLRNHVSLPEGVAADLALEAKNASRADTVASVRGHEGQAAAIYFKNFSGMFKGSLSAEFELNGRKRRPPPDPINACLSFAYSMLVHECVSALRVARLEPSIGGFHVSKPGRPALALDLMEPFRPLISDSVAVTCFNRGELVEGHFLRTSSGCLFTDVGRRSFFNALSRRMDTEVTHPVFGYRLSYRRMIILHARMIAAWIMGDISSLSFLTTR